MFTAIKTFSQVITHMSIAFGLAYLLTGSLALGGLAAIIEPVINVALLPLHEKLWHAIRQRQAHRHMGVAALAGEKLSQTMMHMGVAFSVMYGATGSAAFGGLLAVVEPICNVIALPFHDGLWERLRSRLVQRDALRLAPL
ncbi:DUF2061 domain-containing protein [Janthinobacterium psychrotolerans]|uniref:Putative membrane protein n=1 Tax=Janthinobacterium psychrotolerans TaxID=1747903 RepID=A0A1A7C5R4_9BURK|nr:DUF2061 domain-containing protein [Janthinobacterium psychrotolerans]OBV41261.1 putative membrane protein [Janthinobacterium psychrotolerans]